MSTLISISNLVGVPQPPTVRAPEIEKGVGCDFDSYLLVPDTSLDERIGAARAKLGRDVVILGHHYQRDEVVKFADFRGDSRKPTAATSCFAASISWRRAPTSCAASIKR